MVVVEIGHQFEIKKVFQDFVRLVQVIIGQLQ